ncbi:uncharacterized protein K02A2.6 isoform X2 [Rhipicephalus microplus]|uniref:uncharacterized protein K02A2.6 isoform X2 n=1 Tax=Rhipicephalus microplus TaxID=6941 RepID=UPI003F6CC500
MHLNTEMLSSQVTGDNVRALALYDFNKDGLNELLVGSEDFDIRVFRGDVIVAEIGESEAVTALCPLTLDCFAYALANGTIGVYRATERLWRIKSKSQAVCLHGYDIDGDGKPELITGWSNGKVDARSLTTGEVVFRDSMAHGVAGIVQADYCLDGREQLIVVSVSGEVRGYLPASAELRQQMVDATFEQDTVRELSRKKQTLMLELRNYEAQSKDSDQQYGSIPANTQLKTLLAINSGSDGIPPHVEVALETNNETVIRAVILFAEGIFDGESLVLAGVPVLQPSAQDLLHSTPEPAGAVHNIVDDYHDVFSKDLGLIKGPPATLQLKEGAVPKFCKARSIPYALRDRVTQELDRLVAIGVLSPVQHSDWATPIVPVLKKDGTVRICGDFKATLNPACTVEQYPLPVIEDMFASLNGGEYFSILDLRDAYNQVPLDEAARKLCVINTHRGLFSYNRLPFGISSAPAIFQRKMDAILSGLPGVQAYLDDVLVSEARGDGSERLKSVLQRFREHGVKLRSDKCSFRQPSVTYLGHRIDREGLHPTEKNLEAIAQAPRPQNVAELRSFLGMLTFYAKFLPNMSTLLSPLNKLLEKGTVWQWGRQQEAAFEKAKDSLMQAQVLVQFDPLKELKLECDASPYGVGAALFHTSNGMPKPIGFRSRTLTAAEKNYSQLEREALALVFGVTKFRDYLLGRQFTLVTDHQPLLSLLQSDRPTPPLAAARIQRWALYLGGYRYTLQYTPGKQLLNADALSRLPLRSTEADDVGEPPEYVLALDNFDDGVITTRELQQLSATDPAVTAVKNCILHGWPKSAKQLEETMRPFFDRKLELSVAHGLVYWGHRVVIPEKARDRLLKLLHETHQGSSGMKAVARSKFWWPRLDRDIEALSAGCTNCAQNMPMPAAAPPVNWPKTNEKWSRLHVDFAGPIAGKMILVAVDAHTKWIEAVPVKHATTTSTITCLRAMFSRFGVPRTIVSDNGTQFSSQDFATFVAKNNIMHLKTAPFHPQSNGAAERAVRTIKDGLRKMREGNLEDNLVRLLFNYRRTPQKTGKSPSELLLGFQLRSRLDACFPSTVADSPPASDDWVVPIESNVYVRNYGVGEKWTPGRVQSTAGSRMVTVQTPHSVVRRHVDQVRPRQASQSPSPGSASLSESNMSMLPKRSPGPSTTSSTVLPPEALTTASPHDHPVPTMPQAGPTQAATPSAEPVLRRSTRQRKPVQRFHF